MPNKIIVVGIIMLIMAVLLPGCVSNTKTITGSVIKVESFGGGFGHPSGVTLFFDAGEIISIISGEEKVIMNRTGTFYFEDILGDWYLKEVDYGS